MFKVTSVRLEARRATIQTHIPLKLTFFSLLLQTLWLSSLALLETRRSKAGPGLGPQHPPEHSCLKQNLADPLGLINYRPISRVALSAMAAAAYLLIA